MIKKGDRIRITKSAPPCFKIGDYAVVDEISSGGVFAYFLSQGNEVVYFKGRWFVLNGEFELVESTEPLEIYY